MTRTKNRSSFDDMVGLFRGGVSEIDHGKENRLAAMRAFVLLALSGLALGGFGFALAFYSAQTI